MARIAGINIPLNKRVEVGLTYIYGIGDGTSRQILDKTGIDPNTAVKDLTLTPQFGTDNFQEFIDWERDGLYVLERGEGECMV